MILTYQKLNPRAYAPTKEKDPEDAGFDLRSVEARVVRPGESYCFWTGLAIQWAWSDEEEKEFYRRGRLSYYGQLLGRSGLANDFAIAILGGVIDKRYIGPVGVVVVNNGFYRDGELVQIPWNVTPGTKICQVVPVTIPDVRECSERSVFAATIRGTDGFNSTGS